MLRRYLLVGIALVYSTFLVAHLTRSQELVDIGPPKSDLEECFEQLLDRFAEEAEGYLSQLRVGSKETCPHKTDYFHGGCFWFLWDSRIRWQYSWKDIAKLYTNTVFSNSLAHTTIGRWKDISVDILNRVHSFYEGNIEMLQIGLESRKKERVPINTRSPDPQKLTIVSATDASSGRALDYALQAIKQREEFAQYYNNKFKFFNLSTFREIPVEHPVWYKLSVILEAFAQDPQCEWVWWLDIDAVIMNGNTNITRDILSPLAMERFYQYGSTISEEADNWYRSMAAPTEFNYSDINFVISHDLGTLNMGSFMVRRSALTSEIFEIWGNRLHMYFEFNSPAHERREQDAFIRMWHDFKFLRDATAIMPFTLMNSYVQNSTTRWVSGDTIMHFAGRSIWKELPREWESAFSRAIKPGQARPLDIGWGTLPGGQII